MLRSQLRFMIAKIQPARREEFQVKEVTKRKELTLEEIVRLVKDSQGDFLIHVEFGEEAEEDAKKE